MPSVPQRKGHFFGAGVVAVCGLLLAACGMTEAPQTTFVPQASNADAIYNLFKPIFWLAVAVFVIVEGLLIWSIIRYRRRPDDGIPLQIHGNTPIEIAWTILPAIIVVGIATLTFRTQGQLVAPPANPIRVNVIGHQWWWEFEYPEYGFRTANELHLPAERGVEFYMTSDDVIHSFWIPRLSGKTDVVPGHTNKISFTTYGPSATPIRGQCAEFCGVTHAMMGMWTIVEPQADFDAWAEGQRQEAAAPPGAPQPAGAATGGGQAQPGSLEAQGYQLFAAKGCVGCHAIGGYPGAVSRVGPNLTHVGSRQHIVSGWLENTPANMKRWLRNPDEVKPGNRMAAVIKLGTLTDPEVGALTAYLRSLK